MADGIAVLAYPDTCGSEEHCLAACQDDAIQMTWLPFSGNETVGRWRDEIEREAAGLGIAYVRLGGNIAVVGSGAGLAMATVDLIRDSGGEPANFLDTGGRITREHVWNCLNIVMKNPKVAAVLVNMYGGINPMVEAAHGIVEFIAERRLRLPVVVKLRGNSEEEAWRILESAGLHVVKTSQTEDATSLIVALLRKSSS